MRRRFKWDKKYLYWGITAFCVVACAILFYMALNYISLLRGALRSLIGILSPFIWGLVFTYLLLPVMKALEQSVFQPLGERLYKKNKKNAAKFARSFSVLFSELFLLAILAALIYLILPQLYSSIETIIVNSNTYLLHASEWATKLLEDYPEIAQYAASALGEATESLENLFEWVQQNVLPQLGSVLANVTSGLSYVLKGVYNFLIGLIVSVYILGNLESFSAAVKRILYCVFTLEAAERIREGIAFIDKTFVGFINGKLLDSAIIGLICYIVCVLLRMPYSLLVSVIIGVTNIIPFFGPFIGAIPCAFLILLVNPIKCLIFVIFIVVLQQVDGNIIGPKILGSAIGINGFWVMFSIILGAGLFGFWGMLLGVPVFMVIYTAINNHIAKKLKRSDLPWEIAEYVDMDHIDPVTRQAVKRVPEDGDEEKL